MTWNTPSLWHLNKNYCFCSLEWLPIGFRVVCKSAASRWVYWCVGFYSKYSDYDQHLQHKHKCYRIHSHIAASKPISGCVLDALEQQIASNTDTHGSGSGRVKEMERITMNVLYIESSTSTHIYQHLRLLFKVIFFLLSFFDFFFFSFWLVLTHARPYFEPHNKNINGYK